MSFGPFYNTITNSRFDDNSIKHDSDVINYVFGVGWGVILPLLGRFMSKPLVEYKKSKLIESLKK